MEAHDIPGTDRQFYAQVFRYPKHLRRRDIPRHEIDVSTRESEHPYREGVGMAFRIPMTRFALVVGVWVGELDGETEQEKLLSAMDGVNLDADVAVIKGW